MSPRNEEANQQIRDERREQILAAALKVFARKGPAAAKISDIAAQCGLSHGLIYHYFASKDAMFTELVRRALESSVGIYEAAYKMPGSAWDRLRMITEAIVPQAFRGDSPYYFLIMLQAFVSDAVPQAAKDLVARTVPLYSEYMVPLIMEAQRDGRIAPEDPVRLSFAFNALIQGTVMMKMGGAVTELTPDVFLRLLEGTHKPERE